MHHTLNLFMHMPEALQMPIVMHPTVPTWGEAIKDHWMIGMMGLQVDNSFALLRLILSGILERHPNLQLVMPHVGGILPYMSGRIDHQTEVLGQSEEAYHTTAERVSTPYLYGHCVAITTSTAVRISVCWRASPAIRNRPPVG